MLSSELAGAPVHHLQKEFLGVSSNQPWMFVRAKALSWISGDGATVSQLYSNSRVWNFRDGCVDTTGLNSRLYHHLTTLVWKIAVIHWKIRPGRAFGAKDTIFLHKNHAREINHTVYSIFSMWISTSQMSVGWFSICETVYLPSSCWGSEYDLSLCAVTQPRATNAKKKRTNRVIFPSALRFTDTTSKYVLQHY